MQARGRITADESAAVRVGRQHFVRGEDEAALAAFERVLDQHPRFADLHYLVGLVHERRGDLDAAAASFERALAVNPLYAECALALSTVYERRARYYPEMTRRSGFAIKKVLQVPLNTGDKTIGVLMIMNKISCQLQLTLDTISVQR